MFKSRLALVLASLLLLTTSCLSAANFVVKKIQVQGLQRISRATVLHYLPAKQGEHFNTNNSSKLIAALYKTDFFSNVSIFRDNDNLIVKVKERPTKT